VVRLAFRVTPLAKAAALAAMVGMGLVIYGMNRDVPWAGGAGTVLFFAGAITYYIERFRMFRRRRREELDRGP